MVGDLFIVCMGVVCYLVGFFFGKVFGARNRNGDRPEKCEILTEEKEALIKDLQTRLIEVGKMVQKRDLELYTIKGKFREFNDKVRKKIVEASRTLSSISQDSQMDFYEEFIKETDDGNL